jgi:hypothetical protein
MPKPISGLNPFPFLRQAPMSRMEPDQLINDRYEAIEERLKVGLGQPVAASCYRPGPSSAPCQPPTCGFAGRSQATEQAPDLR